MKIKNISVRLFIVAALSVFSLSYALGATVTIEGGPTAVTVPIGTPTTLNPSFTITNSGSPEAISSATFTSSSNYTSSVDLSNCTYTVNGETYPNTVPPNGCTVGVTLTGENATASPIAGALTVVMPGVGSLTSRPSVEVTVSAPTVPPAAWSLTAEKVEPSTVYTNTPNVVATYLVENTDPANSLMITGASPSSSNTSVLGSPTILSEALGGAVVPNCVTLLNNGTALTPGEECIYAIDSKPTGTVGSATLSLKVTTTGQNSPQSASSTTINVQGPVVNPAWTLTASSATPSSIPEDGSISSTVVYELKNMDSTTSLVLTGASVTSSDTALMSATLENYTGTAGTACPTSGNLAEGDVCYYQVKATSLNAGTGTAQTELSVTTANGNPLSSPTPVLSAPLNIVSTTPKWTLDALSPNQNSTTGEITVWFVVNNTGTQTLNLQNPTAGSNQEASFWSVEPTIASSPSFDGLYTPCGASLDAGSECAYSVYATPTTTAASNDVELTLSVDANGIPPHLSASSSPVVVVSSNPTVAWTLSAVKSSVTIPKDGTSVPVLFEVDNQDQNNNLVLSLSSSSIGSSSGDVTATLDQNYEGYGNYTPCPTSGIIGPNSTCYFAVDVSSETASATSTVSAQVAASNGTPTPQSASTDVTVGDHSGYATVAFNYQCASSGACVQVPAGSNGLAVNYNVNVSNTAPVGETFTLQGAELISEGHSHSGISVCNNNDNSAQSNCPGAAGAPGGTNWCNSGASSDFGSNTENGMACGLSLRVTAKTPTQMQNSVLKVDYTDSEGNAYSAYAKPETYQGMGQNGPLGGLIFTQQNSAQSMDFGASEPQVLTYQVKNITEGTLYIFPSMGLSPTASATPTATVGQTVGGLYPNQKLVVDCPYHSSTAIGEILKGGTCKITLTLPPPPGDLSGSSPVGGAILYDQWLTIHYSKSSSGGASSGALIYPVVFQVVSMANSVTATFVNNCKGSIYLGLASATGNSWYQMTTNAPVTSENGPATGCGTGGGEPSCTQCITDADCGPGTYCVRTQPGVASSGQCYYINPVPINNTTPAGSNLNDNPYLLTAGAQSKIIVPQQAQVDYTDPNTHNPTSLLQNIVANMTIAARVNCEGKKCDISDCSDAAGLLGDGNMMPGWACTANGNITPPGTLGELNFTTGENGSADFYDVSMVNGYSVPISIEPNAPNGNDCNASSNPPYTCGSPGVTTDQTSTAGATIGGSSWNILWSNFAASDQPYIRIVSDQGPACGSGNTCESPDAVCGISVTSMKGLASGEKSYNNVLSCGKFLGYWAPGQACADSGQTAGSPYNCSYLTSQNTVSNVGYTLGQLYQCTAPPNGVAPGSGYTQKPAPLYNETCGCVDWGNPYSATDEPMGNPQGALNVPLAGKQYAGITTVEACLNYTQTWLLGTEYPDSGSTYSGYPYLFYSAFKTAAPSVYSYQFDDQTSTFTAATTDTPNQMNFTVTFCPAGGDYDSSTVPSAANPDSASAIAQQQAAQTKAQQAKVDVGNGGARNNAGSPISSNHTLAKGLSKVQSLILGSAS